MAVFAYAGEQSLCGHLHSALHGDHRRDGERQYREPQECAAFERDASVSLRPPFDQLKDGQGPGRSQAEYLVEESSDENRHRRCPGAPLQGESGGKDQKWKLLDKTWDHIENPLKFNEYVEGEVEKLMPDAR